MAKNEKPEIKTVSPVIKVVYIGPTIHSVGLSKYTIYTGGIPPQLDKLIKLDSLISHLIVPVIEFSKSNAQLSISTSVESQAVKKLRLILKGGNK